MYEFSKKAISDVCEYLSNEEAGKLFRYLGTGDIVNPVDGRQENVIRLAAYALKSASLCDSMFDDQEDK